MARGVADVFQVVVLAAGAHAFLAGGGAGVGALFQAEEAVLELVHAGVGEQQGRVVRRDQRAGGDAGMALLFEEAEEGFTDFCAFHRLFSGKRRRSRLGETVVAILQTALERSAFAACRHSATANTKIHDSPAKGRIISARRAAHRVFCDRKGLWTSASALSTCRSQLAGDQVANGPGSPASWLLHRPQGGLTRHLCRRSMGYAAPLPLISGQVVASRRYPILREGVRRAGRRRRGR
ncbi:hypothetical protein D9M68_398600 [compost metagenome]